MIKMGVKNSMKSKGMLAGYGLIALGVYLIVAKNQTEFGMMSITNGLGIIGIRDAIQS